MRSATAVSPCGHIECGCAYTEMRYKRFVCCVECPLAQCVLDAPKPSTRQKKREDRAERIAILYKRGLSVADIAQQVGCIPRNVYAILDTLNIERRRKKA